MHFGLWDDRDPWQQTFRFIEKSISSEERSSSEELKADNAKRQNKGRRKKDEGLWSDPGRQRQDQALLTAAALSSTRPKPFEYAQSLKDAAVSQTPASNGLTVGFARRASTMGGAGFGLACTSGTADDRFEGNGERGCKGSLPARP